MIPTELQTLLNDKELINICNEMKTSLTDTNSSNWMCKELPGSEKQITGTVRVFGLRAGSNLGKVERHMNSVQHTSTVVGGGVMFIQTGGDDKYDQLTDSYCVVPPGVKHYPSNDNGDVPWVTITWHTSGAVEDVYEEFRKE